MLRVRLFSCEIFGYALTYFPLFVYFSPETPAMNFNYPQLCSDQSILMMLSQSVKMIISSTHPRVFVESALNMESMLYSQKDTKYCNYSIYIFTYFCFRGEKKCCDWLTLPPIYHWQSVVSISGTYIQRGGLHLFMVGMCIQ